MENTVVSDEFTEAIDRYQKMQDRHPRFIIDAEKNTYKSPLYYSQGHEFPERRITEAIKCLPDHRILVENSYISNEEDREHNDNTSEYMRLMSTAPDLYLACLLSRPLLMDRIDSLDFNESSKAAKAIAAIDYAFSRSVKR